MGLLGTAACGGKPLAPDGGPSSDAGGSTDGQTAELGAGGDCLAGLVTAAELAATPRGSINLELLALRIGKGHLVADQAIYDRLVRDVGAIRVKRPDLASITYFPTYDGVTVPLTVDVATARQMEDGTYAPWACLNARLGAVTPFEFIRIGNAPEVFVYVKLEGIYSLDVLGPEYARLPGVMHVDAVTFGGDGPTICVTPDADTWHYVLDAASGDCPAGCIDHAYTHFTTSVAGAVTQLEEWSSKTGGPAPAWVGQYASETICR